MSRYAHTPRSVNHMLAPQPTPVIYGPSTTPYYNHTPSGLGRRQSLGAYIPTQPVFVTASEPSRSRSHHRSSSKSRTHRRSHSIDRHGSGRHHRHHHHRSSTPVQPRYSSDAHYAVSRSLLTASPENADLTRNHFQTPSSRRRHSHSVPVHHHPSSSREPHRVSHHGHRGYHNVTHHRESIGERIKRFFGIGSHRVRYVDNSGHPVDNFGRPIYAM